MLMSNFKCAEFASRIPAQGKPIRGVLVMIPGSNADGRYMIENHAWEMFARKHHLAMVGCYFQDDNRGMIEGYADARSGSGQALLDYIAKEVNDDPAIKLYLFGYSAGGQFAYEFACWKPERTAAFVMNKGGVYYTALAPKATRDTPGLLFLGKRDAPFRKAIIRGIFHLNHVAGDAKGWELIEEDTAHEIGSSERLSREWMDILLTDEEYAQWAAH